MIPRHPSPHRFPPSFALISVLALVSLAALTATAFLSAARLDRRANLSISDTTRIEMALDAGAIAAQEMVDYAPSKQYQWVTTYWRGTGPNDWTNELGYLLNGCQLSSTSTSTICNFYACFSTATMTNLSNTASALLVVSNGATNQGLFLANIGKFMNDMTNFPANSSNPTFINIPLLGDTTTNRYTSPPVGWVYIRQDARVKPGLTNTTNVPVVRFAFYVQDLSGLIDAQRMGGSTTRDTGTNPEEISLTNASGTSLFNNSARAGSLTLSSNRWKYFSPGMLTLSTAGNLTTNDLRYVATGLLSWTDSWNRIPPGLGYTNTGEHKTPLGSVDFTTTNTNHTKNTNTNFCFFLTSNLRQFTSRSGGMEPTRYLHALAANFQDYIDTDIDPTSYTNYISSGGPPVRGVEPLPFLTETASSVWWFQHDTNTVPGQIWWEFHVKNFIELWNPSDRPINNLTLKVNFSNNFGMGLWPAGGNVNAIPLNLSRQTTNAALFSVSNTISPNFVVNGTNDLTGISLPPNAYGVFQLGGTNIFRFRVAGLGQTSPIVESSNLTSTNNGRLVLNNAPNGTGGIIDIRVELYTTNGVLYDRATNHRVSATAGSSGRGYKCNFGSQSPFPFYAANYPGLRSFLAGSAPPALPGDPRMGFYLTTTNASVGYASTTANPGSSLGYRNKSRSSAGGVVDYNTDPNTWLDSGHNNFPYNTNTVNEDLAGPALGIFGNSYTNDYVQRINNSGVWSNVLELGNIFDPMAWNVGTNNPQITGATTYAGNSNNVLTNGGGSTLRIGRPEHARFAWTNDPTPGAIPAPNMMMSSAAFLDLFCISNTLAGVGHDQQSDEGNKINLNTAPAPVLRALAGGIRLTNDLVQTPLGQTVPPGMAEAFAQGVMRFRAQYPFYSPSQLSFISTDYGTNYNTVPTGPWTNRWPSNTVFGNTNNIFLDSKVPGNISGANANLGINTWNDVAAEEWFSKIYRLSTTQSRNFRCYVVAQLVNTNGDPKGPMYRKYYHIFCRNSTDAYTNDLSDISTSTYNIYGSRY